MSPIPYQQRDADTLTPAVTTEGIIGRINIIGIKIE